MCVANADDKEPYCKWKRLSGMNESRVDVANAELFPIGDLREQDAIGEHLPFGMPTVDTNASNEFLLAQEHFVIWYDADLRSPLWTAYHLERDEATASGTRADGFRSDPRLTDDQKATCADFKEPIFDQGHLVPNAAMYHTETATDNTFLMSNMTAQHCAFNRGPWMALEKAAREWAAEQDDSWIIVGAVYDNDEILGRDADADSMRMKGKSGERHVAIPSHQYMIFVSQTGPDSWETLSILMPNNDFLILRSSLDEYIEGNVVSLTYIEERSGFGFLDDENVTEAAAVYEVDSWASPLTSLCNQNYPKS